MAIQWIATADRRPALGRRVLVSGKSGNWKPARLTAYGYFVGDDSIPVQDRDAEYWTDVVAPAETGA